MLLRFGMCTYNVASDMMIKVLPTILLFSRDLLGEIVEKI